VSEIRVDAIKTRAGAVPTANDLGLNIIGTIVQVQSGQLDTQLTLNTNKTTKTDTGLSVTITPKYSNSKLFVLSTGNTYSSVYNDNPLHYIIRTVSGTATSVAATDYITYNSSSSAGGIGGAYVQSVMDSAQSTAAHEYKIQIRSDTDGGAIYFNVNDTNNQGTSDEAQRSTIMVMEIAQ